MSEEESSEYEIKELVLDIPEDNTLLEAILTKTQSKIDFRTCAGTSMEVNINNLYNYYRKCRVIPAIKFIAEQLTVEKMKQLIDQCEGDIYLMTFIIWIHIIYRIKTDFIYISSLVILDDDEKEVMDYIINNYRRDYYFSRFISHSIVSCREEFIIEDIRQYTIRRFRLELEETTDKEAVVERYRFLLGE